MARRRLTPVTRPALDTIPQAPHPVLETKSMHRAGPNAPIAHVAADAAGRAALAEVSEALETARRTGRMILDLALEEISADHLTRDRIPTDDDEMQALRESLRAHGQRTPIEVTPLKGTLPYGLISGWRRLAALKSLHAETGEARFATVQAIVRTPDSVSDAYVNMVEENEIRVGLSHYERARVAALAAERGVFESEKKALLALFATASRAKRSRIRSFIEIYHALDGVLRFPAHLPERLGLALVDVVRDGQQTWIREILQRDDPQTPEEELATLQKLVAPEPPKTDKKNRAGKAEEILPGVTLEQTLKGRTLTLKLKGKGVTPDLRDQIHDLLADLNR